MSGIALIWAANVKGLKPSAKVVLIQLSDFHNKKTGQCNPSAKRLADECEMDRATVFRHMQTLVDRGLVTRHNQGDGSGGRTSNQYEIHIDIVFGPSSKRKEKSQIATGGVVANCDEGSRSNATGVVANCDRNLTIEPGTEPCVSETDTHTDFFNDFWEAHPRPVDEANSKALFDEAVASGVSPERIIAAAMAYEIENEGNQRMYLTMSDNWLSKKQWENHKPKVEKKRASRSETLAFHAQMVIDEKPYAATSINGVMARELLGAKLVTKEQLLKAGVAT